jgi:hypothetical protein
MRRPPDVEERHFEVRKLRDFNKRVVRDLLILREGK